MRKKKWIVPILVALLFVVVFTVVLINSGNSGDKYEKDTYDEEIIMINETFPVYVVIYGEDISFRPAFQYRKIEKIDDYFLDYDTNKYVRLSLVISDLNSSVVLTDEEFKVIKRGIDSNLIDFYYFGTKHINKLIEHGIIRHPLEKGELAVGIALYERVQTNWNGIWTDYHVEMTSNNPEALGGIIVAQIARCIKSNN